MSDHDKRLDEMDSLLDLGRFPPAVHAGAVANVLFTVALTRSLCSKGVIGADGKPGLAAWIALLLGANLLPVAVLRAVSDNSAPKPAIPDMSFVGDQHRFPLWVYVAASANLAFWTAAAWRGGRLGPLLAVSAVGSSLPRVAARFLGR